MSNIKEIRDFVNGIKINDCCEQGADSNATNVVTAETLRHVQSKTLRSAKYFLSRTFGPMGSNTKIIKGNSRETITSSYSKDGLKVLENIVNSGPIEASIVEELIDITKHVEHEVGDGTTSTVILSSIIFDNLLKIQNKYNIPPYQLIRKFNKTVHDIETIIKNKKSDCTLDDIYNIAMISTNGNTEVATNIKNIYSEYGMDVDLTVGISNNSDSVVKVYDGLTITEGMSDPVFINNRDANTSEIRNAKVYHFADPIDTMDMIALFEAILTNNIYDKIEKDEAPIPTVITCPRLSKDMTASLKILSTYLYKYDQSGMSSAKPPILIISNVVASDEVIMDDIATLCGCKSIRKYIDANIYKKDQEDGKAPTVDNVTEFAGDAELVVADAKKTKFINPKHMHTVEGEEDPIYTAMVNFLKTEIDNNKSTGNANENGLLRKRYSALKSNMVEYLVGGVTVSERDSIKDLVEDAVKNCKSSSLYGTGHAANFEGLSSSYEYINYDIDDPIINDIAKCIFSSYCDITEILYGTVCNDKEIVSKYLEKSIELGKPYDISSGILPDIDDASDNVKCSIMLDINIMDTISKIISIMVTCNQCLLQSPQLNNY